VKTGKGTHITEPGWTQDDLAALGTLAATASQNQRHAKRNLMTSLTVAVAVLVGAATWPIDGVGLRAVVALLGLLALGGIIHSLLMLWGNWRMLRIADRGRAELHISVTGGEENDGAR
jgi:hypothetical protein